MKLIRLSLKNFRQHVDTVVEFREGMTAIIGANGSGKTSLLDAVLYVLYGKVPGCTVAQLRSHGAKDKVEVKLEFSFEGGTYEISRSENNAYLNKLVDGNPLAIARGLAPTAEAARRLMNLTLEQFANSFCARQKEVGFFTGTKPDARQAEIARVLGYDRLKKAKKEAEDAAKELRAEIRGLEPVVLMGDGLAASIEQAKSEAARAAEELRQRRNELGAIEAALPKIQADAERAQAFKKLDAELMELKQQGRDLDQARDAAAKAVAAAEAQCKELESLRDDLGRYAELDERLRSLNAARLAQAKFASIRGRREELTRQAETARGRRATLKPLDLAASEKAVGEATRTKAEAETALRQALEALSAERQAAAVAGARAKAELDSAIAAYEEAKNLVDQGLCPTCRQPTDSDSFRTILALRTKARDDAASAAAGAATRLRELEADSPKVAAASEAAAQADARYKAAQAAHDEAKASERSRAELEEQIEGLLSQIKSLDEQLAAAPPMVDEALVTTVEKGLADLKPVYQRGMQLSGAPAELERARAEHQKEIQAFDRAKQAHDNLKVRIEATGIVDRDAAEAAIATLNGELIKRQGAQQRAGDAERYDKACRDNLDELWRRAADIEEKRKILIEKRQAERLRKYVAEELEALRVNLNGQIRPEMARLAAENLAMLTHGRYGEVLLSESFEATIVDDGVPKPVISGGEQDVLALALRLALSELIQDRSGVRVSILVLDEVFGSLDADRRQAVLERLDSLKDHYSQVVVISHIDEINEVADHCLEVRRDPKTGIATVVEASSPVPRELVPA